MEGGRFTVHAACSLGASARAELWKWDYWCKAGLSPSTFPSQHAHTVGVKLNWYKTGHNPSTSPSKRAHTLGVELDTRQGTAPRHLPPPANSWRNHSSIKDVDTNTHACMHARTDTHIHIRTHIQTHTRACTQITGCDLGATFWRKSADDFAWAVAALSLWLRDWKWNFFCLYAKGFLELRAVLDPEKKSSGCDFCSALLRPIDTYVMSDMLSIGNVSQISCADRLLEFHVSFFYIVITMW